MAALPDLDSLRLFVATVSSGSLTKAAASAHLTLPSASRRISLLEQYCGEQLLVRTAKGVELTPAGELVYSHAGRVVEEAYSLRTAVKAYSAQRGDAVRVFANTSAVMCFLPADLESFISRFSTVQVHVLERGSRQVVDAVKNGDGDIGIFNEGPNTHGLRCWRYRQDHLAVILPKAHPISGQTVSFAKVLGYSLITLGHQDSLAKLMIEQASALGLKAQLGLEMKSFQSVCRMVKAGMGIAVLPMQTSHDIIVQLDLKAVALEECWATRTLWICARGFTEPRKAVHSLLTHLTALPEQSTLSSHS